MGLADCIGTKKPYMVASRATSLSGVTVLREFEDRQITER